MNQNDNDRHEDLNLREDDNNHMEFLQNHDLMKLMILLLLLSSNNELNNQLCEIKAYEHPNSEQIDSLQNKLYTCEIKLKNYTNNNQCKVAQEENFMLSMENEDSQIKLLKNHNLETINVSKSEDILLKKYFTSNDFNYKNLPVYALYFDIFNVADKKSQIIVFECVFSFTQHFQGYDYLITVGAFINDINFLKELEISLPVNGYNDKLVVKEIKSLSVIDSNFKINCASPLKLNKENISDLYKAFILCEYKNEPEKRQKKKILIIGSFCTSTVAFIKNEITICLKLEFH